MTTRVSVPASTTHVLIYIISAVLFLPFGTTALEAQETITPYCGGFVNLNDVQQSLRISVPPFPVGFGHQEEGCIWSIHAPPDAGIKLEIIEIQLGRNESLHIYDGNRITPELATNANELDQAFLTRKHTITCKLKSGRAFKGTVIFQVTLQKFSTLMSAGPTQCGGTITLDYTSQVHHFNATNIYDGNYPAYCVWHVISPPMTVVRVRFLDAILDFYDNFMVMDSRGTRLAEFFNIKAAPYDVYSDSNEAVCVMDAYTTISDSFVQVEVSFVDRAGLMNDNIVYPLSGAHINLTESSSSCTFQSNNFSSATNVYAGSYWFVSSPHGTKIKVDFLDVDTGSGVYLDVRNGDSTPIASLSGSLDLGPLVSLDNALVIWLNAQWRNPGNGATIKVSLQDDATWDGSNVLSSCGGAIELEETTPTLRFSTPNYASSVDQYTVCYWYITSPQNTRVALEYLDFQAQNGYLYVYDSVAAPSVMVSSITGEGVLPPFESFGNGVTLLYNDLSDTRNGRGLLAKVTLIEESSLNASIPLSSCGGQISLDTSASSRDFNTPGYPAQNSLNAYTSCYWYVIPPSDYKVSLQVVDMHTVDASFNVYDSPSSLQNQVAKVKGETAPTPFISSDAGVVIHVEDFPSSYQERGISAKVTLSDGFSWDESTVLTSCGGTVTMDTTSTSLVFTTPNYPSMQPDGIFDCMWYFDGPHDKVFSLEVLDVDTSETTYFYVFDSLAAYPDFQVSKLSGSDITTTVLTSNSALFARFYDPYMTDTARGLRVKISLTGNPSWDESVVLDSCGSGVDLDFNHPSFLFSTPNYPNTNGDYFDCRWYVRSPSDTVISAEFHDFATDSSSYLAIYDGDTIYDQEILRVSGTSIPSKVNVTGNAMTIKYISDKAQSGLGASLSVAFTGGELPESDVRLVDGSGPHEGRVELYHDHIWGTICDDDWGVEDATVICRMMGYRTVIAVWTQAYFGSGSGQIWMDDVQCTGFEKHITDCTHRMPMGSHNCGHNEDAGVTCGEGADVTCDGNSMTILIDRVLLAENDGASDVYLLDDSCVGYDYDSQSVAITTAYDHCDTKMEETEDMIIFSNVVTYFRPKVVDSKSITRTFRQHVPVTCTFNRHAIISDSYNPLLGVVTFTERGYGNFSLDLSLYADITYNQAERKSGDAEVTLGEPVYLAVNLSAVTALTLLVDSCWATRHPYPFDPIKYRIIENGCAVDKTVQFYNDNAGPMFVPFSVDAFAFIGEYTEVYIHCEVLVCDYTDPNSRCRQGCERRAKRNAPGTRGASSRPHAISNGPISAGKHKHVEDFSSSNTDSDNVSTIAAMAASGVLVAAGVMMAYVTFLRRHRSRGYRRVANTSDDCEGEEKP